MCCFIKAHALAVHPRCTGTGDSMEPRGQDGGQCALCRRRQGIKMINVAYSLIFLLTASSSSQPTGHKLLFNLWCCLPEAGWLLGQSSVSPGL